MRRAAWILRALPVLLTEDEDMENSGRGGGKNRGVTNCDFCANYLYDEEDDSYGCMADLDEDEYYHYLTGSDFHCPFYRSNDEYEVVRHQI